MAVYHVVALKVAEEHIKKAADGLLALKDLCKRDGKNYIRSIEGGKQVSTEAFNGGMQIVLLVIFENQADCDYYTFEDPAHQQYKKDLRTWGLAGATVLDFAPGQY